MMLFLCVERESGHQWYRTGQPNDLRRTPRDPRIRNCR